MSTKLTFAEHIHELRRRLMWSLLFVAVGAVIGYFLHDRIVWLLQQPLGERLYYTTPTGAFSFIVKVCCVFGLIVALPMVIYQTFGFFQPLIPLKTRRSLLRLVMVSFVLAIAGIVFAYFVSLPAALHFLVNFGNTTGDIQALITAEEYFNFVLAYIAGFAVLFQLPLIITFINRVKPLKPHQLFGSIRFVILGSFIISAIITPTPDPLNQSLMALPIIFLYFISILIVMVSNHRIARRRKKEERISSTVDTPPIKNISLKDEQPYFRSSLLPEESTARPVVSGSIVPHSRAQPISDVMLPRGKAPTVYMRRSVSQMATPRPRTNRPVGLISDFVPVTK